MNYERNYKGFLILIGSLIAGNLLVFGVLYLILIIFNQIP